MHTRGGGAHASVAHRTRFRQLSPGDAETGLSGLDSGHPRGEPPTRGVAVPQVTEVQRALSGVDYPADRDHLVEHARQHGASDDVIQALEHADADRFDGPDQVMRSLKGQLGNES
jgi:hypothetical protein